MIKKIINPFVFIAGGKTLITGLLILLLTSAIGYFSGTHFPDIISVKTSNDFPIWYFIFQNYSNWLVLSFLLYILAILFSKSSVRIIDIFGTQAFARFPYLLASFIGFSESLRLFGKYLIWTVLEQGEPVDLSMWNAVFAVSLSVINLTLTVWVVILMFNAFKVSANLKGRKLTLLFILAFLSSIIITRYLSKYLALEFS